MSYVISDAPILILNPHRFWRTNVLEHFLDFFLTTFPCLIYFNKSDSFVFNAVIVSALSIN
jgi:hypothetical protein